MLDTLELKELERAAWCANDKQTLQAIEVAQQAAAEKGGYEVSEARDSGYNDGREAGYDEGRCDGRQDAIDAAERLAWRHLNALIDAAEALARADERLALLAQAINDRQPAAHIQSSIEAVRTPINSAQVRAGAVANELEDFYESFTAAEKNLKGLD